MNSLVQFAMQDPEVVRELNACLLSKYHGAFLVYTDGSDVCHGGIVGENAKLLADIYRKAHVRYSGHVQSAILDVPLWRELAGEQVDLLINHHPCLDNPDAITEGLVMLVRAEENVGDYARWAGIAHTPVPSLKLCTELSVMDYLQLDMLCEFFLDVCVVRVETRTLGASVGNVVLARQVAQLKTWEDQERAIMQLALQPFPGCLPYVPARLPYAIFPGAATHEHEYYTIDVHSGLVTPKPLLRVNELPEVKGRAWPNLLS